MKIGIFGGTFDPFHGGHCKIAVEAAKKLDKVFIVPTVCDYYRADKRHLFTFDEKCIIITQLLAGVSNSNIKLDSIEKDKDSKWRFVNTVEYFKKKFPNDELYVIIGEDSYKNFKTWFRYDDILNMATLMVVQRGTDQDVVKDIPCETLDIGKDFLDASSTVVRNKLISELMDMYLEDFDWYTGVGK